MIFKAFPANPPMGRKSYTHPGKFILSSAPGS